tara:strand:+ start:685 stop:810 length:126 start_codon:yes stop_codon:yes gene_type:complete
MFLSSLVYFEAIAKDLLSSEYYFLITFAGGIARYKRYLAFL